LLALTLCLSIVGLVHAQTANNIVTTVTPFSLQFLSGQAFNVQDPSLNTVTFAVSSGALNGTGTAVLINYLSGQTLASGTVVFNPSTSGSISLSTSYSSLNFVVNGVTQSSGFNFSPSKTYTVTWSSYANPLVSPVPSPVYPNSIGNGGAWQYLLVGNFVGFIFAIWGAVLTVPGFAMILGLIISLAIYLQMKNLLVLIALWTIIGTFFIALMPLVSPFAVLFYILAICGVIYKILASPKP
jgi:hypothetical protein